MSFSVAFVIFYFSISLIGIIIQFYLFYSKRKVKHKTLIIVLLGVFLFVFNLKSTELSTVLHRYFLFNSPFQKDLLPLTKWNGKYYILIDAKNDLELMEVEVDKDKKALKLFKNSIIYEKSDRITFQSFETEKVELMDE